MIKIVNFETGECRKLHTGEKIPEGSWTTYFGEDNPIRLFADYGIEELANLTGFSINYLRVIANGAQPITRKFVEKVCRALKRQPMDVFHTYLDEGPFTKAHNFDFEPEPVDENREKIISWTQAKRRQRFYKED